MISESILNLKMVFASLPMKGLFFWEVLLYLDDDEYKRIVEEKFIKLIGDNKNDICFQNILETMDNLRKDIANNHNIKSEVEKIRESLFAEMAHETAMDSIRKD